MGTAVVRVVQFETPAAGRRIGIVDGWSIRDVTSVRPELVRVVDAFFAARHEKIPLATFLVDLARQSPHKLSYQALLGTPSLEEGPILRTPVDHADPHRVLVSGTGLTHTGSATSRDSMHATDNTRKNIEATDSARMFAWGLMQGKPETGRRGIAPEWFYKGNGTILRGPIDPLDIPSFAVDGGEEPEIVGCYVVDENGEPWRLGFALGNEWSDHPFEKKNYLYLAPSKLRTCAVGPELVIGHPFDKISLECRVVREGTEIYRSGPLESGESAMCHSLANLEDHHFKFPGHRGPGDVHLHFFGTSKLSFGQRSWTYKTGDEIQVAAPGFSATLRNTVLRESPTDAPRVIPNA